MVPPADQLGVDTEGEQREGDREQGRSTKTRARWMGIHGQGLQSRAWDKGQESPGLAGSMGQTF